MLCGCVRPGKRLCLCRPRYRLYLARSLACSASPFASWPELFSVHTRHTCSNLLGLARNSPRIAACQGDTENDGCKVKPYAPPARICGRGIVGLLSSAYPERPRHPVNIFCWPPSRCYFFASQGRPSSRRWGCSHLRLLCLRTLCLREKPRT